MTLKQLEAFYWAAKLGTFAIAAQRLAVTQSTLSKRIAELEASIDHTLFDRSSKRPTVTETGEKLLATVKQMIDLAENVRAGSGQIEHYEGRLRFGVSELSAATWFPRFANRLRDEHPRLVLEPQIGEGIMLERQVDRGELDFAIIAGVGSFDSIASEVVAEVDFTWMAASPGPGSKQDPAHAEVVITPTSSSKMMTLFSNWATSASIGMARTIHCNSLTTTVGLVVAGAGISCLPKAYVSSLAKRGLLVPVRGDAPKPTLDYSFISRVDDTRSLISVMKALVKQSADFNMPNALWAF